MTIYEYKLNRIEADIALQQQRLMIPSFIERERAKKKLSQLRSEKELYSKMAENAQKMENLKDSNESKVNYHKNKDDVKKAV